MKRISGEPGPLVPHGPPALAAGRRLLMLHGMHADPQSEDAVERWGRRIGHALSVAGCVALALYLYATYFR